VNGPVDLREFVNALVTQLSINQLNGRPAELTPWGRTLLSAANRLGNIRKGTAVIAVPGVPTADDIIGELFHLASSDGQYTDKELAEAVRQFPQYVEVADKAIDPSRNIYDSRYQAPSDWTEKNQGGYSAYFHYAQFNICFTAPANNGMKRLLK